MKAEYIDHMGSDLTVVNAARVSFDKESDWEEIEGEDEHGIFFDWALSERDGKLIHYLARERHWTPFSHVQITLRETVPIFVARQRFKHMVGFTYNEVSRRYVDDTPDFYIPTEWRGRADNKKQGSTDTIVLTEEVAGFKDYCDGAVAYYQDLLDSGVAPEQARMVLPQAMYTSYYVTGSLAAWARAYKLRIDSHAQKEIQELAHIWGGIIRPLVPVSWDALTKDIA